MENISLFNKLKSNKTLQSAGLMIVGMVLYCFSNGKWIIPVFAWIAPFFLIRVFRNFKKWWGIVIFYFAIVIVQLIRFKGMIPGPAIVYYVITISAGMFVLLPYLSDRWLHKKLNGFISTLTFPVVSVIIAYFFALLSKSSGSWGALAYTQNNPVFLQFASLTGIWGLVFLVAWAGSVLNWLYDEKFVMQKIKRGLIIYLSVLTVIFLYGEIRTGLLQVNSKTVRIATITHDQSLGVSTNFAKDSSLIQPFRNKAAIIQDDVLNLVEKATGFGAKFIVLHEGSLIVLKSDEGALISRACSLAKKKNIYLGLCYGALPKQFPKEPAEGGIVWINPKGSVIWEFNKANPAPGDPIDAGDKVIKTFDTPYGRISSAICCDMDHPSFINQAGRKNVDIMMVPAHDWEEIDEYHANMARLRAIENGFSLVRCTGDGLSMATDYQGKTLGKLNSFNTKENIMISDVPVKGTTTLYAKTGDIFVWICIFGFIFILWEAFYKRKLKE